MYVKGIEIDVENSVANWRLRVGNGLVQIDLRNRY